MLVSRGTPRAAQELQDRGPDATGPAGDDDTLRQSELQLIEVRNAALADGLERGEGADGSRVRQRTCRVALSFH